jgi:hypothetical protein
MGTVSSTDHPTMPIKAPSSMNPYRCRNRPEKYEVVSEQTKATMKTGMVWTCACALE